MSRDEETDLISKGDAPVDAEGDEVVMEDGRAGVEPGEIEGGLEDEGEETEESGGDGLILCAFGGDDVVRAVRAVRCRLQG